MSSDERLGWWAEYDDGPDNPFAPAAPWRVTLQANSACFTLDGVAFYTEEDCRKFIRSDVLGKPELS